MNVSDYETIFLENKILQLQPFVTYGKCLYCKSYLDATFKLLWVPQMMLQVTKVLFEPK